MYLWLKKLTEKKVYFSTLQFQKEIYSIRFSFLSRSASSFCDSLQISAIIPRKGTYTHDDLLYYVGLGGIFGFITVFSHIFSKI